MKKCWRKLAAFLKQCKKDILCHMCENRVKRKRKAEEKQAAKWKKQLHNAKVKAIKQGSKSRVFMYATAISACIVAILDILYVCALLHFHTGQTEIKEISGIAIESGIMANCVSILGFAVAVWAGLNITNAIERKELYKTEENLETVKSELGKLQESQRQIQLGYLQDFSRMLFASGDEQHYRFAFQIKELELPEEIDSSLIATLIRLEAVYNQVYELHKTRLFPERVIAYAEDSIKELKPLKIRSDLPEVYRNFILFLHADFLYYKAFALEKTEAATCFLDAGEQYLLCLQEMFGLSLRNGAEGIAEKITSTNGDEIAYFLNSIGSCYSEAIERVDNGTNHQKMMAESCCEEAVKISKTCHHTREVYFRNYGCAIERCANKNDYEAKLREALKQYKEALKKDSTIFNAHYTVISTYNKLIRQALDIEAFTPPSKRDTPLHIRNFDGKRDTLSKLIDEEKKYLEFAHTVFPAKPDFYVFHLYWYIFKILTEPEIKDGLISEADKVLEKLDMALAGNEAKGLCRVAKEDYEDAKQIKA